MDCGTVQGGLSDALDSLHMKPGEMSSQPSMNAAQARIGVEEDDDVAERRRADIQDKLLEEPLQQLMTRMFNQHREEAERRVVSGRGKGVCAFSGSSSTAARLSSSRTICKPGGYGGTVRHAGFVVTLSQGKATLAVRVGGKKETQTDTRDLFP